MSFPSGPIWIVEQNRGVRFCFALLHLEWLWWGRAPCMVRWGSLQKKKKAFHPQLFHWWSLGSPEDFSLWPVFNWPVWPLGIIINPWYVFSILSQCDTLWMLLCMSSRNMIEQMFYLKVKPDVMVKAQLLSKTTAEFLVLLSPSITSTKINSCPTVLHFPTLDPNLIPIGGQ